MMGSGRKRGEKGLNTSSELSIGDLVLAKVEGFPAWPAKISRPEDRERAPDPKKYFVQFFGTSEIGFVPPTDIQEFSIDLKNKLSVRSKGKTVKFLAEAAKEIKQTTLYGLESDSAGGGSDDAMEVDLTDGIALKAAHQDMEVNGTNVHPALERCSQRRREARGSEEVNFLGKRQWLSPDINNYGGRRARKLLKDKTDGRQMNVETEPVDLNQVELSQKKNLSQRGREIAIPENNEVSYPAKRSKSSVKRSISSDTANVATKISLQTNTKVDSKGLNRHGEGAGYAGFESTASKDKLDNRLACGVQVTATGSLSGDEDVVPPAKCCRRSVDLTVKNRLGKSLAALKNGGLSCADNVKSLTLRTKRRIVRLCEDEEEEPPKTPVHGVAGKILMAPHVLDASRKTNVLGGSPTPAPIMEGTGMLEDGSGRELILSMERTVGDASPRSQQEIGRRPRKTGVALDPCSPMRLVSDKLSSKGGKTALSSPKASAATDPMSVMEKLSKNSSKPPDIVMQQKAQNVLDQIDVVAERSNASLNRPTSGRSNRSSSFEMHKATSTSNMQEEDFALASGSSFLSGERPVVGRGDKTSSSVDSKISDPVMSMKNLIAAAQAKRRQAHSQNFSANSVSVPNAEAARSSPSHASPVQPLGSNSKLRLDAEGFQSPSSLISPSSDVCELSATHQHKNEQLEEKRISSGQLTAEGSLSLGTEAAVARDAFEGMIETLSRTKESIGRATRLAIECAKYGISNELMELIVQRLENEPSFHRKVDLFFLVDSITQCSHNHKGVASASYLPTVQAALPRLLTATAPAGADGDENRRQCLKVLRLWLERKILPESLLRHYMDEIEVANDDESSGFCLRLPSRAERAVDDPIREMEGMLVDEYGSNATFQLPGFLSSDSSEDDDDDEEDMPSRNSNESAERSLDEHASVSRDLKNHAVTRDGRRHCILEDVDGELEMEDVDGELEMEDVSGHLKDERWSYADGTFDGSSSYSGPGENLELALNNSEFPPLREGSPPLPPDSPPPTPPLPSSPPPPLPPCSPSSPPPPPPPCQSHAFLAPPGGAPSGLLPQQPLPHQLPTAPQCLALLPSSTPPSPPLAYQNHPPTQRVNVATGNQLVQVVGYALHGSHSDVDETSDLYPQESPCFISFGVGNSHQPTGYGQIDVCINPQHPQSNQQFQAINQPFAQRSVHLNPPPQDPANHFSYLELSDQHHQYSLSHPLPNLVDAPRRFIADEQWKALPVEFNNDHHHSSWMAGARSCSGASFGQEGFLRPLPERAVTGTFGFLSSVPNALPSGTSIPGRGKPGREDMHTLSWRPV